MVTMGASLANGGVNPITGKQVVAAKHVAPILSEMTLNGLSDMRARIGNCKALIEADLPRLLAPYTDSGCSSGNNPKL